MPSANDGRDLRELLYRARESLSMWADVVEARTGGADTYTRRLIADIDHVLGGGNETELESAPM